MNARNCIDLANYHLNRSPREKCGAMNAVDPLRDEPIYSELMAAIWAAPEVGSKYEIPNGRGSPG